MKWGYNWELGPFEMLDAIGVRSFVRKAKADGVRVPEDLASVKGFYAIRGRITVLLISGSAATRRFQGKRTDIAIPMLKRNGGFVEGNAGASVVDLGDGVFCVEFHTKMNAIDDDILSVIHMAIRRAEEEGIGMVIANDGRAFSAGANLALLKELATDGEYGKIEQLCQRFQKTVMALKYSKVPVIAAPHGFALGGGCEVCLHADALVPARRNQHGPCRGRCRTPAGRRWNKGDGSAGDIACQGERNRRDAVHTEELHEHRDGESQWLGSGTLRHGFHAA